MSETPAPIANPYVIVDGEQRFDFVVDPGTGHGRFLPLPSPEFLDAYYNGTFTRSDNPVTPEIEFRPEVVEVMAAVCGYLRNVAGLPDKFTFHDVGCGFGAAVHAMQKLGITATGNESNRHWVEAANPFCHQALSAAPLDQVLDHLAYPIDVFFCTHVLEHLPDPQDTLRLMARHLSPGGVAYLCVPNTHCLRAYQGGIANQFAYSFPMHLNYFTPKSLCSMLRAVGLEPIQIETRPLFEARPDEPSAVESLFNAGPGQLPNVAAWQTAACSNLLGGELFVLEGRPENPHLQRQAGLDDLVERAFRLFTKRWPTDLPPGTDATGQWHDTCWRPPAPPEPAAAEVAPAVEMEPLKKATASRRQRLLRLIGAASSQA